MTKKTELKIHGFNACMAVFKNRPEAIVRMYLAESRLKTLGEIVKYCVKNRKAYHVQTTEELTDVSGAQHHEGVCLVIKLLQLPDARELQAMARRPGQWLALEEVGNPHNLGAIQRSAAHFGARGVFLINPKSSWETGAFYRVAEGGAEAVPVIPVESVEELFELAQELGLKVLATSGHHGSDLYKTKLPAHAVFLLGAEGPGLSKAALKHAPTLVRIPGTGSVESLNVSTAAAVLMGEYYRQHIGSV